MNRLPYVKGEIIAFNWDARMRAANKSHSLDDLMRLLLKSAREHNAEISDQQITLLMNQLNAPWAGEEIRAIIQNGQIIKANATPLSPCTHLVDKVYKLIENKNTDTSTHWGAASYYKADLPKEKLIQIPQYELNRSQYQQNSQLCPW